MRLQKKLFAFSLILFFGSIFFVQQAYGIEGQELSEHFQANNEIEKCGKELCYKSKDQVCFEGKTCFTKISADSATDCSTKGGNGLYPADVKWISDSKSCYLAGNALQKYNDTASFLGYKLATELKSPTMTIRIPGLFFSDITKTLDSQGNIYIPWLGEYLTAIYKFALGIVSIVAVIIIILQGIQVLVSAGGEEKMAAYKKIAQAIVGLIIMWGSYVILYNINPNLISLKPLKVLFIAKQEMPNFDGSVESYSTSGNADTSAILSSLTAIKGDNMINVSTDAKAIPELTKIFKESAAAIKSKGCIIASASAIRTGFAQLNSIVPGNGCKWSDEYKTYINCKKAVGDWGSVSDKPYSTTCKYTDPKTPETNSKCKLNGYRHYKAIDAFAVELSTKKSGVDGKSSHCSKANCHKERCQLELIKEMTNKGACVLLGSSKKLGGGAWEPWHFEMDTGTSYCFKDAYNIIINATK